MKSKRAKEYLKEHAERVGSEWETGPERVIWPKDARKAVEIAEKDARERAKRAFCKCCQLVIGWRCGGSQEEFLSCNQIIKYRSSPLNEFLKYYDNE